LGQVVVIYTTRQLSWTTGQRCVLHVNEETWWVGIVQSYNYPKLEIECIDAMGSGEYSAILDLGGIMRNRQYIDVYQMLSTVKDVPNTNSVVLIDTNIKSNASKLNVCLYSSVSLQSKKGCITSVHLCIYNNTTNTNVFDDTIGIYEGKRINMGEFSCLIENQGEFQVTLTLNMTEQVTLLINHISYCKWSLHL
jgi:hypothetical protein